MFLFGLIFVVLWNENSSVDGHKTDADSLDAMLLNDVFPESSPRCRNVVREESDQFESFRFSASDSSWSAQSTEFESLIFQTEIRHKNPDPTRSWKLRVGQGGNIYSFRGAFGEAIPPQHHYNAPFVDEVWQMVAVNQMHNRNPNSPPYYIHQSGVYMKDGAFTELPFYSPSVASHCEKNAEKGIFQCSFASWGQHAHVPSQFHSSVLFFSRYQDCGNGVIEVTSAIQNIADKRDTPNVPEELGYLNVPWGGVRTSTLENILLSDPSGELHLQFPIQQFGAKDEYIPLLRDTGGFTTFAQKLKPSKHGFDLNAFKMPEAGEDGMALPNEEARKKRGQREQQKKNRMNMQLFQMAKQQQNQTDSCEDNNYSKDHLKGVNLSTNITLKEEHHKAMKDELRLIVKSNNSCQESPRHTENIGRRILRIELQSTVEIKSGERVCNLVFINARTGERVAVNQILSWSWAGRFLFFSPANHEITANFVNNKFKSGDEIEVRYNNFGKDDKDNLALTFVHGLDPTIQTVEDRKPSRLRFGSTSWKRDYTVFSVNVRTPVNPGETYVNRHYIISGKYSDVKEEASKWISETYQNVILPGEYRSRQIQLISLIDGENFGVTLNDQLCLPENAILCSGWSRPGDGLKPLFYIECDDKRYIGSDLYFFSRSTDEISTVVRAYVCHNAPSSRPKWKLLGFFEEGSCNEFMEKRYDSEFEFLSIREKRDTCALST